MRHMAPLRRVRVIRRTVLPGLDNLIKRDGMPGGLQVALPVRPGLGEPARKARPPSDAPPRARKFTGRTRSILTTAAVAAILVNAGVAWTYWRLAEAGTRRGGNGAAVQMALPARSDLTVPLAPGGRGDLLVTLVNNYDFPVRITAVTLGPGRVLADDEHRDAGCADPVVELTREKFPVLWDVQKNTIGAFTIPDGLIRAAGDEMACEGAVFTIPIQATGESRSR